MMKKRLLSLFAIALALTSCKDGDDATKMFEKRKGDIGFVHNETDQPVDLTFLWLADEYHYHIEPQEVLQFDELDFWHIEQDYTLDTRKMIFCFADGTGYTHQTVPDGKGGLLFVPEDNNIFHVDEMFHPNAAWNRTKGNPNRYDYYIK